MLKTKNEQIAAVSLLFTMSAIGANPTTEKMNILWLVCEDISPTLSFYGDSTAHTPNLDKLASESLVFDNAFATVGVSAPSRSSIITGMYPISIGTQHMRTGRDVWGWGERGYGKVHNGYEAKGTDSNGDLVQLYSAVIPEKVKCFTEYLRADGFYCSNNDKSDYQFAAPVTAWDANGKEATWGNRPINKPFFSIFNFMTTHESQIWGNQRKKLALTVSPSAVPLPAYYPDDSIVRQDVARHYSNIELLDIQIGLKIDELKKAGLYDKTIIFFYSDHGGPLPRGKRESYDSGLKVPLMVRFPKAAHAGRTDDLISFVDLAPTILSLTGIKPPKYMQGQAFLGKYKAKKVRNYVFGSGDRFDEFSDRIRIIRDKQFLFVKNYYPNLPAYKDVTYRKSMDIMNQLLVLNDAGKLSGPTAYWFRTTKAPEEFYDCATDPYNLNNLIENPNYATKIAELRQALKKYTKNTKDYSDIPEAQMLEQMWPGGIQPQTTKPELRIKADKISIVCKTKGASIAYLLSDKKLEPNLDSGWLLYHNEINTQGAKYLYVMANRIGFADSEIISKELQ